MDKDVQRKTEFSEILVGIAHDNLLLQMNLAINDMPDSPEKEMIIEQMKSSINEHVVSKVVLTELQRLKNFMKLTNHLYNFDFNFENDVQSMINDVHKNLKIH